MHLMDFGRENRGKLVFKLETKADAVRNAKNLLVLSTMCGWRKAALGYAKELVKLKPCAKDPECVCQYGGRVVSLLRDKNASAADAYYRRRLSKRCPYRSTWQMPTPPSGYAAGLKAQPFWDPETFALGRLLRRRRAALVPCLRAGLSASVASCAVLQCGVALQISCRCVVRAKVVQ